MQDYADLTGYMGTKQVGSLFREQVEEDESGNPERGDAHTHTRII